MVLVVWVFWGREGSYGTLDSHLFDQGGWLPPASFHLHYTTQKGLSHHSHPGPQLSPEFAIGYMRENVQANRELSDFF